MVPADLTEALAALRERRPELPLQIHWHDSVASTMDLASARAGDGAPHGVVVGAEHQTAGRGRRGHEWSSPEGAGLYFSFVARPTNRPDAPLSLLTLAAGVAVRQGIRDAAGLAADLKWPNDVLVGKRKLAGILAEGLAVGSVDQAVIVGVGLNVRASAYPPAVAARATSIEGELGRGVDRGAVLAAVLAALCDYLTVLSPSDILQAWRAASASAIGTRVEWDGRHGTTAGIDDSGALLVKTGTGTERIIAGELTWHL
jgi:BirA family biotin operon repressor/biotin-[acetyl-CoA-carboxylase] ligase